MFICSFVHLFFALKEEKLDEFFHTLTHPFEKNNKECASCETISSHNMLVLDLLDSLLSNSSTSYKEKEEGLLKFLSNEEEKQKCIGWRNSRRKKSKFYADEEEDMRHSVKILCNSRPPIDFMYYRKTKNQHDANNANDANDQASPPLFDGSIGNQTGSLLHLSCIMDEPFILAVLLVLGADPRSKYSAFRRLPIHEAACNNSSNCLILLLELARSCSEIKQSSKKEKNLMATKHSVKHATKHLLKSSQIHREREREREQAPLKAFPFLTTLHLIRTLIEDIQSKRKTAFLAAKQLIHNAPLPLSMRTSLSSSLTHTLSVSDGHGNTALHWSAFKNCSNCVSILLEAGANPNARTYSTGWTPLHDAAYSDAPHATQLLLNGGADVDARANSGATPLCFAAQEDAPQATAILLQAGADTHVRCCGGGHATSDIPLAPLVTSRFSGYTPLHYCAHYNAARAARVLIQYGAPLEIHDLADRLPIHVAVGRGSSDVLRELLCAGAKVDTTQCHPSPNESTPTPIELENIDHESNASIDFESTHVITPASSPILRQMLPREPVNSSKPWNCLSQKAIDECASLIEAVEGHWSPNTHKLFSPKDRRAVLELLRVGKRLEQQGTGLFLELWPYVLSFCGRGWFETPNVTTLATLPCSQSNTNSSFSQMDTSTDQQMEDGNYTQFELDSDIHY